MLAEIRSGAWRALSGALQLSGTQNVQQLQVEPAQPVLDLWDLTRYGAQDGPGGVFSKTEGWGRVSVSRQLTTGVGIDAFTMDPYTATGAPRGRDVRFWVDYFSVLVEASADLDDFGSIAITTAGVDTAGFDPTSLLLFASARANGYTWAADQIRLANQLPQHRPTPVPLFSGGGGAIVGRIEQVAAAGDLEVFISAYGRYLPAGIQPR